ncbi:MAG: aspartate aminotransferase family protein [Alphaproteobacteria bacterium]|nr:aspartate aminotransferase family protein [Alphaproteobacteria bacterium]
MTETARWQALDRDHHLHPFTDHKALSAKGARVITRADGCWLWDSDGNRILDGMAGLWCVNVGYGRTELIDAAHAQMSELPYYNAFFQSATPSCIELAAKLAEIAPGDLSRVFFANSGSEANDTAVKIVRYFWNLQNQPEKKIIISRELGYHGVTLAAASLSGLSPMHPQADLPLAGFEHVAAPYWYGKGGDLTPEAFGRLAAAALEERILELGPHKVAAFIGEPVQGAGGVIIPPDGYWREIQRICEQYDVLLIADEVICGFGRTGRWWGSESFDIKPDILTMAKGLSSGYLPISAVMTGKRVGDALADSGEEWVHGFTYSGHPVAAAVALENIRIMEEEGLHERASGPIGNAFAEALASLRDHPLVGETRSIGLIGAIELVADKDERRHFPEDREVGGTCRDHCIENGLVMRAVRDIMVLSPPLIIDEAEIGEMADRARAALDLTARDLGI